MHISPSLLHPYPFEAPLKNDPLTGYSLYLPFNAASPTYRVGATNYNTASLIPGYSFTRSGAKSELNASGSPIAFAANVPGIVPGIGYWSRGALTNYLLNAGSASGLSTQSVTTTATQYTLSFIGTGAVTLTGTSTAGPLVGTGASNRVALVFTPTAGTLTLTVTGSVTYAGLIDGNHPQGGPIIATAAATASIGADVLSHTQTAPTDVDQLFFVKVNAAAVLTGTRFAIEMDDGTASNRIVLYLEGGAPTGLVQVAGVTQHFASATALTAGQDTIIVLRRLTNNWRSGKIAAGVLTWGSVGAAGTFPAGMTVNRYGDTSGGGQLEALIVNEGIKVGTFTTDAEVIAAASI